MSRTPTQLTAVTPTLQEFLEVFHHKPDGESASLDVVPTDEEFEALKTKISSTWKTNRDWLKANKYSQDRSYVQKQHSVKEFGANALKALIFCIQVPSFRKESIDLAVECILALKTQLDEPGFLSVLYVTTLQEHQAIFASIRSHKPRLLMKFTQRLNQIEQSQAQTLAVVQEIKGTLASTEAPYFNTRRAIPVALLFVIAAVLWPSWSSVASVDGSCADVVQVDNGVFKHGGFEFKGSFQVVKWSGYGVATWPNKDTYTGYWDNALKQGQGEIKYGEGTTYMGLWKDDKRHGQGTVTKGSESYTGQWEFGKKSGRGIMKFEDGKVYSGLWENDLMHGNGTLTLKNGDFYEGDFKHGKKSGQGKRSYIDGGVYEGSWADDKWNGPGQETHPGGGKYIGQWVNNSKEGEFTYTKHGVTTHEVWKAGKKVV
jgi:hypothetical protein